MKSSFASCIALGLLAATAYAADLQLPVAPGPFQPTDESLQQYQCPEWFRDAKLGIWSHWGPVAAPGGFGGNWYARQMYVQGTRENLHHVATRGHPSKFGYKDIIELWKAEKFDPDRLMDLYVKAGAKYFVSMGAHHDNFDLWNSKHQEWNAVNHGPRKDIVGLWRDAARKRGLRFGVSEHFARSYNWMQRSHGSDTNGPMPGVPYDGADPKYARLYGTPHGDRSGGYPTNPPATWTREWFDRMQDLVHSYQPDLVYSDGGIPFGAVGRSFMADFYNTNLKANGGKLEAVYTIKKGRDVGDYVEGAAVQDEENTVLAGIKDQPWQTDTSIGTWFFVPDLEPKWRRTGPDVIVMLTDVVAKNGNLLLNIPQRGDGTIDAEAEQVLAELAAWTQVNGEAIFATRPWKILGEGPALTTATRGIKRATDYTAADIRFTRSKDGATLYAIALGWPAGGKLEVRSLARAAGAIRDIQLLGHVGALAWTQGDEGLEVTLPAQKPCETAFALKISGADLQPAPILPRNPLEAEPLVLTAARAQIHGAGPKYERSGAKDQIGYWNNPADFVAWDLHVARPGSFTVEMTYSATTAGSPFEVAVGGQTLSARSAASGSWSTYRTDVLGTVTLSQTGAVTLVVKPRAEPKWNAIGLKAVTLTPAGTAAKWPIAGGPFQPSLESLSHYQCPDWFRDAKFGIWAHWGAQCEPEDGDWYARNMYIQGHRNYQTHTNRYGHPSEFGFKDVCNAWKADQFDPERLLALYKKAGAQYFVAMANHHDNFDNWDSKYQPWNSVKFGPKKDLIGLWEKAARKAGLRFGVTVHAARAWEWYEASQLSDTNGPKAGVPYDGNLTAADGKGKWWEGLDPQDLYAQRHPTSSDVINRYNPNRTRSPTPNAAYAQKFYNRVIDLLDSHKPDLLYFDDGGLPLGGVDRQIGLSIVAHLYNSSIREHGGRNEAVMNTKRIDDAMRKCWVLDIERGVSGGVDPRPWQTDTCIGVWHYQRSVYEKHGYKTVAQVVHTLMDIISKNGNLLLNIPVRGNGTIDADEEAFLAGLAEWMDVNREAVFGTRPWKIFGEGPAAAEQGEAGSHGGVKDTRSKPYTAADFRFTTKDGALYATALAWPADGQLVVRTLASNAPGIRGEVQSVELLGVAGAVSFERTAEGLTVKLPPQKPCEHAFVLKITGLELAASEPRRPASI